LLRARREVVPRGDIDHTLNLNSTRLPDEAGVL
jgi:hypothetical protein